MLLIAILWPVAALNVTLTELDVFSLDLLQVFQGQDLRFNVSKPPPGSGNAVLKDRRSTSIQVLNIPSPYNGPGYQPLTNGSFVCLDSHCVTFGGNLVKVFSDNKLVWAGEVTGTVEAATLFQQDFVCASVAHQQRQIVVWQLPAGNPVVYIGEELQSLQNIHLRANPDSLVVFSSSEVFVYNFDSSSCSLSAGQLVPGLEAIVEVQPYSGDFLVLDQLAGLVRIEPAESFVFISDRGRVEGTFLRMSLPRDKKVVVQTTEGLLFLRTDPLQVFARLDLHLPEASLWMLEDFVVALTPQQGFVIDKDQASVIFSFTGMPQTIGFGCWVADKLVKIFQEDGMNAYLTTVEPGPVELELSNTLASYTLQLIASSLLRGEPTALFLQVTHLNSNDSRVYYGSGFELFTEASELKYSSYFTSNFSGLRIPLGDLFSGPALNYSVTLESMQPETPSKYLILEQSLIQKNPPYPLLQVRAKPQFGCIVQSQPSLFLAFSGSYLVLIKVNEELEMRSVEISAEPLRCVAHGTVLWVYAKKLLFRLYVQLDPLALALISENKLDFDCEHIYSNDKFCVCLSSTALLVSFLDSEDNVLFNSQSVSTPHQPFNLTSACFLGKTSSQLLLADINNGLNVVDLNAVIERKAVPFLLHLQSTVAANTTVHFSQDKLVVIGASLGVYRIRFHVLELIMTLPQGPGLPPCWGVLVDNLLYVNQETYLNVYNLNTSVHQALYMSLPLSNPSEFLVFSLGKAHCLLRLSILGPNDYNLTEYFVVQSSAGPAVEVGVFCDGCLQAQDMHLNLSITASSPSAQASRLMQITMINKGSFVSVKKAPPACKTVATDKNWTMPLIGLFEGNELVFSLELNGEKATGPVNIEGGIEGGPSMRMDSCADLQTYDGRIYCLSGQNLTVLEVDSNFTIATTLTMSDDMTMCSALAQVRSEDSKELLAVVCSQNVNPVNLVKFEGAVLILLVYNWHEEREENRTVLPLISDCDNLKIGRRSSHSASLFCLLSSDHPLTIQEYSLNWTADFKKPTLGQARLLTPSNTNLSSFLPSSFDVNNSQDSFTLLVVEKNAGLVLLEPNLHDYQVAARVPKEVLDALAANESAGAFFCGGEVLVTKGSHVLLFNLTDNLQWTRTIYPYSVLGEVVYINPVFCSPVWPLVLASVVDDTGLYLRLLDLSLLENSRILMDIPGFASGVVVSKSLVVYSSANFSELQGLYITPPTLSVPVLSHSEFEDLKHNWHTNVFNVAVVAANRQGAVSAPTIVIRRMVHHEMKSIVEARNPMAPWSLAMWFVYLVLVAVLTVATVRAYALGKFR